MSKSFTGMSCKMCSLPCIFAGPENIMNEKESGRYKREIFFKKGETLFKQGTFSSKIIYIKEGLVKLVIEGNQNKNLFVKFFGRNGYLGLNQLFSKNESNYTAVTLKDTKVCMIEINYFKKMAFTDQRVTGSLFELLTYENDFLRQRLRVIGTNNLYGRLAHTLLYIANEIDFEEDIYSYITRRDLADLSVMSVESLERLLSELRQDGIVKIKGKKIEIVDFDRLKALSYAG